MSASPNKSDKQRFLFVTLTYTSYVFVIICCKDNI